MNNKYYSLAIILSCWNILSHAEIDIQLRHLNIYGERNNKSSHHGMVVYQDSSYGDHTVLNCAHDGIG